MVALQAQTPSIRVDREHPPDSAPWSGDRGAGVIRPHESLSVRIVDTIFVYAQRSRSAPPIAFVLFDERGSGTWRHSVVARDSIRPHFVEFGYEILGLPIDAPPVAGWARVILGKNRRGIVQLGWTPADTTKVEIVVWRDHLARDRGLYFLPPRSPAFFSAPGGRRGVRVALRDSTPGGYAMMPDTVVGDWMRVRVMSPTVCTEETSKLVRVAWIRYLAERGRPRVFYFTRGC